MNNYERLLFLSNKTDTQSTPEKILELNELLSSQDIDGITDSDLQILDDLISTLSNTDNLFAEKRESIINLQEAIRTRIFK